jgi:TonB-dependent starch-binding outer membrane protein SusC
MKRFLSDLTFSLILVFGLGASVLAQMSISGIVTDAANNEPLIGANVLIKGTGTGTITDIDGTYALKANAGDVLVFSYAGYTDQETTVGSSKTIDVALSAGRLLDEVVVVGYGTQRTKEVTSAVVSVSKEQFNQGPISDPAQLLQGKVSGLQIYNRGGDPNRASTIRMRGISTVGANVEPLIVIDGIIGASLQNVDPNDIESMDVLKDGSAAAIYGSRGSSGVILITTKKGSKKAGGVKLNYNGQLGVSDILRSIQVMSPTEFLAAGGTNLGSQTVWLDQVTQTGINQVHGVSAEGGAGNTSYRISANIRQVDGILQTSGFDQLNTRLNFNTKALNDKLTVDFNTSFTQRDQNFAFNEALRYAVTYNPTAPVFGENSPFPFASNQFGGYFESLGLFDAFNPVSILNQNQNTGRRVEFNYGANLGYSLLDNLNVNFRIAQQNNTSANRQYYPTTSHFRGNATSPIRKGRADFYNDESRFKLYEAYATHLSEFGRSNLTITGGYSYQQNNFTSHNLSLGDFPNNDIDFINRIQSSQDLQNAGFIGAGSASSPDEKIIAFFGRANYSFDDAIFINASMRREGSTKLGEDNQWGWFPALGLGVDLNKYAKIGGVDLLKARIGYGVTGSLPLQNGLSKPLREIENGPDGSVSTRLVRAANPDLKWEEKAETNLGIDFGSGRFRGTLDLYNRDIKDFILERRVDVTVFGVDRRFENAGKLNTKGLELALSYDLIKKSNVSYTTGVVLSTYKTVLEEYVIPQEIRANLGAPGQNGTNMILVKEGQRIGQIWGPVFDGVDDMGNPRFKDVNGDGRFVTDQDKGLDPDADFAVLGNGLPTLELGWTNNISYKGWNINAFFRGAFGHSLVNTFRAFYEPRLSSQTSYNFMNTSLVEPNLRNARFSSLYVEKADFFKLDNLTISRNIPLGNIKAISNLNVALTAQNLFVITKYTGTDPEPALVYYGSVDNGAVENISNPDVLSPGIDSRNNYFSARTFTLGVNFNF